MPTKLQYAIKDAGKVEEYDRDEIDRTLESIIEKNPDPDFDDPHIAAIVIRAADRIFSLPERQVHISQRSSKA